MSLWSTVATAKNLKWYLVYVPIYLSIIWKTLNYIPGLKGLCNNIGSVMCIYIMFVCIFIHILFFFSFLRSMFEQVSIMEENPYAIMWTLKEYLVPIPGKEVYGFVFPKAMLVFSSVINKSSNFFCIISFITSHLN